MIYNPVCERNEWKIMKLYQMYKDTNVNRVHKQQT